MFDEMIKTAKEILKSMDNEAVMVANQKFELMMVNFKISDGERTIMCDVIDDYFLVNDGNQEYLTEFPWNRRLQKKIYSLGEKFLKNHTYIIGLNF